MSAAHKLDPDDPGDEAIAGRLPWVTGRKPPTPADSPTLRAVFDRHYAARLELASPRTREAYQDALAHWERYSGNPPAAEISSELLAEVQSKLARRLRRGKPISPATVDRTFRHLRPVVELCFPRDRRNPRGLGLVDYLEFPRTVTKGDPMPKRFSTDELDRLYRACDVAKWPRRVAVPAPLLWRVALVGLYNLGPRVFDLFAREWGDVAWTLEDVGHPYGGIMFTATKTRKVQRIPFNAVTQAHFAALRGKSKPRIFCGKWTSRNKHTIGRTWSAICEAADVARQPLNVLRKTADTAYERIRPGVGAWILGHSCRGVNARNYFDPTEDVCAAVLALPQPPAFVERLVFDRSTRRPLLAF